MAINNCCRYFLGLFSFFFLFIFYAVFGFSSVFLASILVFTNAIHAVNTSGLQQLLGDGYPEWGDPQNDGPRG
jgi:hypothetical protein